MNNNDYSLFNNILLPVPGLSWYFEGLVVFLTLYSTLLPLSHSNDTSVSVSQLLTCLHSLFTGVSLTALQTWVLSSSFFDLLLFYFFEIVNSISLPLIQAGYVAESTTVYNTRAGCEQKINVSCVPFLLSWVSSLRGLLSLQLPKLKNYKIKAFASKAVTQDKLMCNLPPLGI